MEGGGGGRVVEAGEEAVRMAVEALKRGGVVAVPTDTLYGMGASRGWGNTQPQCCTPDLIPSICFFFQTGLPFKLCRRAIGTSLSYSTFQPSWGPPLLLPGVHLERQNTPSLPCLPHCCMRPNADVNLPFGSYPVPSPCTTIRNTLALPPTKPSRVMPQHPLSSHYPPPFQGVYFLCHTLALLPCPPPLHQCSSKPCSTHPSQVSWVLPVTPAVPPRLCLQRTCPVLFW